MGAHSLCSGLLQERWSDQGALRSSSWCCNPSTCLSCHRAIAVLAAIVLCFGGCIRGTAALATHNTTYRIGGLAITGEFGLRSMAHTGGRGEGGCVLVLVSYLVLKCYWLLFIKATSILLSYIFLSYYYMSYKYSKQYNS